MHIFNLYFPTLAALALGVAGLPHEARAISYDGYKAFRINVAGKVDEVLNKLSSLSYEQWNFNSRDHLDISLSGDQLAKFETLGLDYTIMHEDLGLSISEESTGVEGGIGGKSNTLRLWPRMLVEFSDLVLCITSRRRRRK
jgi:hypothetical protein